MPTSKDNKTMTKLKTKVSQAYWFNPSTREFKIAKIPQMHTPTEKPEEICWFDKLFEGGIDIPEPKVGEKRALTTLITGPPGSGKSTLALEICYRLTSDKDIKIGDDRIHSLYVTSESDEQWLKEKANSFKWLAEDFFAVYEPGEKNQRHELTIWQTKTLGEYVEEPPETLPQAFLQSLTQFLKVSPQIPREIINKIKGNKILTQIMEKGPHLLVIDSLNTAKRSERPYLFNKFMKLTTCGPRLIIFIIDSERTDAHEYWEFLCDNVIKLDTTYREDYMIRTIEIVKARYQQHIWGKHQLKIYKPSGEIERGENDYALRRAHPYRKEGGIFIFPSIHYYLSSYKRRTQTTVPEPVETYPPDLKKILQGFPKGRCTGFIGSRGGHKSHLGYVHLLYNITKNRKENDPYEKGLVISLRDDEGMARQTMNKILKQEFRKIKTTVEELEKEDKLEIIYYPPGYITPEEFFHRMFLSIHRMKEHDNESKKVSLSLLFNSLDQLSSRFPLCAKEDIFVPGIIETLSAEDVTSFFIAVEEPGQPAEQYGLLSMADVIIKFSQKLFPKDAYCNHLSENLKAGKELSEEESKNIDEELNNIKEGLGAKLPAIVLRVVRFAGGQAAGDGGILELINDKHPAFKIYSKYDPNKTEGLYFTPFSPKYSQGESPKD